MTKTLKQRLSVAMRDASVTAADLARACKIKPPSVSDWLSGETKSIRGSNLLAAARLLGVNPEWLDTGQGPRDAPTSAPGHSQSVRLDPEILLDIAETLNDRYALEGGFNLASEAGAREFARAYEIWTGTADATTERKTLKLVIRYADLSPQGASQDEQAREKAPATDDSGTGVRPGRRRRTS
jgi:transcriptional regulator with XRE-family HTH domain